MTDKFTKKRLLLAKIANMSMHNEQIPLPDLDTRDLVAIIIGAGKSMVYDEHKIFLVTPVRGEYMHDEFFHSIGSGFHLIFGAKIAYYKNNAFELMHPRFCDNWYSKKNKVIPIYKDALKNLAYID